MTRPLTLLVAACVLPLALAACSSTGSPPESTPPASAESAPTAAAQRISFADVLDRTFTSTAVLEDGVDRTLASEAPIAITFSQDTITAKAGCNTLVGTAAIVDGAVVVEGELASTMMACDAALMDQDAWLAQFLASSPAIAVDEEVLTLESPTVTITLTPLETVGRYDTPLHGPEALAAVQAMCDELVAAGASVDEARATAENQGYVLRITKEDGEFAPATMDLNPGRLNLEVTKGIVTGCTAG